jgi:hypothetical protein
MTDFIESKACCLSKSCKTLKVGDVVTVINRWRPSFGYQGQISDIMDSELEAPIKVIFGLSYLHLLGIHYDPLGTIGYHKDELRYDEDFSPSVKAINLWGRNFVRRVFVFRANEPFTKSNPCQRDRCQQNAVCRSMINICGDVYELDLCLIHSEMYSGHALDSFPWKSVF